MFARLKRLLDTFHQPSAGRLLYEAVVAAARQPRLFAEWQVPDTLDGRFEAVSLHAFLVLHRLKSEGTDTAARLAQETFDAMFVDMDRSVREMGAADMGVGRRVKAMAEAFYGRIAAYEAGLAGGDGVLAAAIRRNLFGTVPSESAPPEHVVTSVCGYVRDQVRHLAGTTVAELEAGRWPNRDAAPG